MKEAAEEKARKEAKLEVDATKRELALDWNNGTDKFGLIKGGK